MVETLDAAEVKRDTRDDDKMLVGELRAVFQGKRVLRRSESAGCLVVELELRIKSTLQVDTKVFFVLETSSDKSPAGLVVVPLSRVDDCNIFRFESAGFEKLVADRCACCTSADHDNLVVSDCARDGAWSDCRERA